MAWDQIVSRDSDKVTHDWFEKLTDAEDDILAFVDARLEGGGTARISGVKMGRYNLALRIDFDNQPSVVIRFPKTGHTVPEWTEEKIENEVQTIEYIREHTTIPVPSIRFWVRQAECPGNVSPFIVSDYAEGVRLSAYLRPINPPSDPEDDKHLLLDPTIEKETLDIIYEQIAGFMVQMAHLEFSRIGAISKHENKGEWSADRRILTREMNDMVAFGGYPKDKFPDAPFKDARAFFENSAAQLRRHLETQKNIALDSAEATDKYIARCRYEQIIPRLCVKKNGPFVLFCPDFKPSNMLIDMDTLRITAVFDFEFANALPAQFAYDPPSWLLLQGPERWLFKGGVPAFERAYVPRMEQFIDAMARVESRLPRPRGSTLASKMSRAWDSGRFWFNYATRMPAYVDEIYWQALHERTDPDFEACRILDAKNEEDMQSLVLKKMRQQNQYDDEMWERYGQYASGDD